MGPTLLLSLLFLIRGNNMTWRLALDMGTNSLGWAAFALSPSGKVGGLKDSGVRIFSDGREPSSKDRVRRELSR